MQDRQWSSKGEIDCLSDICKVPASDQGVKRDSS
jgi:hypothetical protein